MEDIYAQCLEIGKFNKMKEFQAQLSQFLQKNSYFRQFEKTNTNLDLYTQNYSQYLRFETFPCGKVIYTASPPKQFYIVSGRTLTITPKKDCSLLQLNTYIESVVKKIKKGQFKIDKEDDDSNSKDFQKTLVILKAGDGFGDILYQKSAVIALEELNAFTCLSNQYQKCFELIHTKNNFITESLSRILSTIDKNLIANDLTHLFIEHSFISFDNIFQSNQTIDNFYILRQGFCEIFMDKSENNGQEENTERLNQSKKNFITIKQGELFGHEDYTGSNNNRIFSCRSITPNTVVYSINKDQLISHKNEKIKSLILNNAFSKYHFYMQNFKSKGIQQRQEKSIVIRQSHHQSQSQSNISLSSSNLPQLPSVQIQNIQPNQFKERNLNEDRVAKSSESQRSFLNNTQNKQTFRILSPSTEKQNSVSASINKSPKNNQQMGLQSSNNTLSIPKQFRISSSVSHSPNQTLRPNGTRNQFLYPNFQNDNNDIPKSTNSFSVHIVEPNQNQDNQPNIQNQQELISEKPIITSNINAKNNNLQENIDYIKSLKVSNEPYKIKPTSILSFFNPQPQNSLSHIEDDTINETEINMESQKSEKFPKTFSQPEICSSRRDSRGLNSYHLPSQSSNSRVTHSFKLLNDANEQETSLAADQAIEDDISQKRKLLGGTNLSAYKRSQIAKKTIQSLTQLDGNYKNSLQNKINLNNQKKINIVSQLDKKVRFKGCEEINIENFNNYDDIIPVYQKKYSSMSAIPDNQSPVKSILRRKEDLMNQLSPRSSSSNKFSSKTLKQLEGITQQKVIIVKKSQNQKNQIIQSINSKF